VVVRRVNNLTTISKILYFQFQAQNLGKYLKDEKFDRVFTSDLRRCHDTTLNILKHSTKSPPEPVLKPILRERVLKKMILPHLFL